MKILKTLGTMALVTAGVAMSSATYAGRGEGPVVYVTTQGLFYDSIVVVSPEKGLPMKGPFQKLETGGESGFMTEFGPGDIGHVGGRWWIDADGDGYMNEGDVFFLCPLLGPGRTSVER
ncbi:MAG: hypothetical protein GQ537_08545 [Gammaproteobacteria bacterium]|nr:hypothetical protein [Gammaproteobacteria bacterium]